jgi:DNA-binding MurR/RpiR family transcriptional regulator
MDVKNGYQRIQEEYDAFSPQQKKVADFILTNIDSVIYFPVSKLVSSIGVSQATIVRFAQHLGYPGFNELRDSLFAYYREYLSPGGRMKHSIEGLEKEVATYESITRREIAYLESSARRIDEATFGEAVRAVCRAETVYVFGVGPDEPLACHLHFRLRRMKVCSQQVSASGRNLFEHLLLVGARDLAVAYAFSKPSSDFRRLMAVLAERKVPVILITDMTNPPAIRMATYVLRAERGPLGTFPSPLVPMAVTNALILRVAEQLEGRSVEALKELGDLRDRYLHADEFKG